MQLLAALRKDALLQWRTRAHVVATFVFGSAALLLFSFAVGPNTTALREHAGGFLWLALLQPASPVALYYGKALANWAQLALLGCALVPVMVVLYDAAVPRPGALLGVILLGTAGLSAPGTLYAAMTTQARARQALLPLLLFPLVVPALLASVKSTSLALGGDPMGQLASWATLLVCFDAVYWALCGLLFARVVED